MKRSLAPDLARGFMLLAIALAHTPLMISRVDPGIGWLNSLAQFVNHLLVNNQARPLFVFLFGYGLSQLMLRQQQRGQEWVSIRKLFRRRGFWLLIIGFAHGILLVPLDIIAVYGLALLMCAGLVRAKDSTLLWIAGITFIPATALAAGGVMITQVASMGNGGLLGPTMKDSLLSAILAHLAGWPFGLVVALIMVIPGMMLGIWAGRRRFLDEPQLHESTLRRVALVFIGLAVLTRLPAALVFTDQWTGVSDAATLTIAIVHPITGYFGGIGMAALIGVIAIRPHGRSGRITSALAALGQRSLTFYVFQSVVFLALFYPFTLDLRDKVGFAGASGIAVGIWVFSVAMAEWMHRNDYRGPLEKLLRQLYRKDSPRQVPPAGQAQCHDQAAPRPQPRC